jgi:hypothetical protein
MTRAAAAALPLLAACATTNLPPVGSPGFQLEDEERAIWRLSTAEQERLDAGGDVHDDGVRVAVEQETGFPTPRAGLP